MEHLAYALGRLEGLSIGLDLFGGTGGGRCAGEGGGKGTEEAVGWCGATRDGEMCVEERGEWCVVTGSCELSINTQL